MIPKMVDGQSCMFKARCGEGKQRGEEGKEKVALREKTAAAVDELETERIAVPLFCLLRPLAAVPPSKESRLKTRAGLKTCTDSKPPHKPLFFPPLLTEKS